MRVCNEKSCGIRRRKGIGGKGKEEVKCRGEG